MFGFAMARKVSELLGRVEKGKGESETADVRIGNVGSEDCVGL